MSRASWQRAANILCVRLDSLGDVLMTTPALRALKEKRPDRRLTLLTSPAGGEISGLLGDVDQTIVYEAPWVKATGSSGNRRTDFEMIDVLRQEAFDAAVIFTVFSQSPLPAALMTCMADIPLRLAHCRENPYHLLTDWVPETDHAGDASIRHEVRRQLDLVASIGCTTPDERLGVDVSPESVAEVLAMLKETGLDISRPWLVLHPGASAASRRYPGEYYAEAARTLAEQGLQVLFTGGEGEEKLVERIRLLMQVESFSLAGRLDLRGFSALIFLAPLLITNNTGPAHISAAVQTPVVDLYALTNPQHSPWKVPHRVLYHDVPCKFCYKSICPMEHHDCLRLVRPDEVVHAAFDLLKEGRSFMDLQSLDLLASPPDA